MDGADHGQPRIVKYGMKLHTPNFNRNDLVSSEDVEVPSRANEKLLDEKRNREAAACVGCCLTARTVSIGGIGLDDIQHLSDANFLLIHSPNSFQKKKQLKLPKKKNRRQIVHNPKENTRVWRHLEGEYRRNC
ncbi:hypothetical protein Bca52824_039093 [Brassica carinata]|uniref:Uncharacterized protein n=1 Tax=Brassica carinata TaxID=52824 RepID=A0A8X7UVM2_BRACI|nr:hypothetical protein Bca52824_039093 [Brassica carinata]